MLLNTQCGEECAFAVGNQNFYSHNWICLWELLFYSLTVMNSLWV